MTGFPRGIHVLQTMDQPAGAPGPDGVQPPVSSWPKHALWSAAAIIVLVVAGMLYTWGLVEIQRCFNEAAIFCKGYWLNVMSWPKCAFWSVAALVVVGMLYMVWISAIVSYCFNEAAIFCNGVCNGVWQWPEAAIAVVLIVAIAASTYRRDEWRNQVSVFVIFIWQKYLVEPSIFFLLFMLVVAAIVSSFGFLVYLLWVFADILYKALSYVDYQYCSTINNQEFFICDKIYYMKGRLHEYFALLVFVMALPLSRMPLLPPRGLRWMPSSMKRWGNWVRGVTMQGLSNAPR